MDEGPYRYQNYPPQTPYASVISIIYREDRMICHTADEDEAKRIVEAMNAWEWLKENIPTNMKMWGLLPANYCIKCKREHDDGDCYA